MITRDDYFKAYAGNPEITAAMLANADDLLTRVNALRAEAEADGVEFQVNPSTGTAISGTQNGGWRPQACKIGAPKSAHKQAQGVDSYDPTRRFASWCMAHHDRLDHHGLYMEDPRWTATWLHLQSKRPGSGNIAFVPSADPPVTRSGTGVGVKLTDLKPRWIYKQKVFAFRCPHCRSVWLTCKRVEMSQHQQREIIEQVFGEHEAPNVVGCKPSVAWKFSNLNFPTMTITPSLDASPSGHWHGHITNGAIT